MSSPDIINEFDRLCKTRIKPIDNGQLTVDNYKEVIKAVRSTHDAYRIKSPFRLHN